MTEQLQSYCDGFIRNRDAVKEAFYWDSQYIIPVCACYLAERGMDVNSEKIKECGKLIEKNTGVFSGFRSSSTLPIATLLYSDSDPEQRLANTLAVYDKLKKHFGRSGYTALVSAMAAGLAPVEEAERLGERGKVLFDMMRSEHPFLTDSEDSVFAVLMAFSGKTEQALFEDMEACYKLGRKLASDNNSAQSLSHVLALYEGSPEEKTARTQRLYDLIVGKRRKYGKGYELAVLAALAMAAPDLEKAAGEVAEVETFLEGQRGYSGFGIDKKTRTMHAALITSCLYSPTSSSAAAITGTIAMLAAQNAMLCAIIAVNAATP